MTQSEQSNSGVSDERLHEFIAAYKAEFGDELSPGEASILFRQLLQLYLKLSQPLPDRTTAES